MREKQEAQEGERCFTTFDKADGDVAFTSNVAEANESGAGNFKIKEAQVEVCEKTLHVEWEVTNGQEGGPNNNKGFCICTPHSTNTLWAQHCKIISEDMEATAWCMQEKDGPKRKLLWVSLHPLRRHS